MGYIFFKNDANIDQEPSVVCYYYAFWTNCDNIWPTWSSVNSVFDKTLLTSYQLLASLELGMSLQISLSLSWSTIARSKIFILGKILFIIIVNGFPLQY